MSDRETFISALYVKNYKRLVKIAYRLTGDIEAATDLVQDTFLLAMSHYAELTVHPNHEGWITVTLENLARNYRRQNNSHGEIPLDEILNLATGPESQPLSEVLPAKLPSGDKQILIWRFEQQLSYLEIANRLGISEAGCRSRVFRAIERCRNYLDDFRS